VNEELLKNYNVQSGPRGVLEIANVTRDDLAKFIGKFSKMGVEVGVAHGKYSEILMDANPDMKLYGVDPYTIYSGYKDYALLRTMATLKADAYVRLDRFPNYEFIEKFSLDAAKDFEDGSLDFVYIDANHADPYVTQDIEAWTPKVKKGGIVSGHDYAILNRGGPNEYKVISATNKYTRDHNIQLYIWGLQAKDGQKRDGSRSWMFFNE
jgi:hypothetical protein